MALTTKGGQENGLSYSDSDFQKVKDEKIKEILAILDGFSMSQIEQILESVGNYTHLFPIRIIF